MAKIYELAKIINRDKLTIDATSQIDDFVFFNAGQGSEIGQFVHISSFCSIIGGGRFYMEDFSGLSAGCRIITASDDFLGGGLTNPTVPAEFTNVKSSFVRLKKHVILGTNVVVLPGVTIGEGAAVGAGCIVRKDLEPWTIYVGADCRPIKERPRDLILAKEIELLKKIGKRT